MPPSPLSPQVSIVVPLYNGADRIERALDSVRAQTHADWELFVVDDCSSDAGPEIVRDYISRTADHRITLVVQAENRGPSAVRNDGVRMACGQFIMFLDCDDELLPGALTHLLGLAAGGPVDIVGGAHIARTDSGRLSPRPDSQTGSMTGVEAVQGLLQERIWNYTHGKIYSRQLLQSVSFREDIRRYEDIIFNACAFSYSKQVVLSPEPVHVYSINGQSTTWTQRLTADFVHDTEAYIREGLNPDVAPQVSGKSWRTMRATLAVVVLSNAIAGDAEPAVLRELRRVLRRNVKMTDLPDVVRTAPLIGISALVARVAPRTYAWLYRRYVARTYELGA
ncbi:glycosyltransferase family 2 protein [Arthrobacter sp. KNU40]|uniref:glycosyltransferase family 2 protein n=1 Tax=Arthrobacter sp. KNU40 TaxID=3447965 RepID=UPI003F63C8AD